jgi:hypothetical protein
VSVGLDQKKGGRSERPVMTVAQSSRVDHIVSVGSAVS